MSKQKAILVFQTDFTYSEGAVAAMYGVVKTVDPQLEIMDATHQIPKFDVYSASYRLFQYYKFWPSGTVFVSVIDPGVGTKRKAAVALTKDGYYIVTPDNGALTHLCQIDQIKEIREIDESVNRLKGYGTENVAIFHGRDLFGYCAAKLAAGIISYEQVGEVYPLSDIVRINLPSPKIENGQVYGHLEISDPHFGNVWTDISHQLFSEAGFDFGDIVNVTITCQGKEFLNQKIPFEKAFGMVNKDEAVIYLTEINMIGLAINQDSMMGRYNLHYGADWEVTFSHE